MSTPIPVTPQADLIEEDDHYGENESEIPPTLTDLVTGHHHCQHPPGASQPVQLGDGCTLSHSPTLTATPSIIPRIVPHHPRKAAALARAHIIQEEVQMQEVVRYI
eukprot:scaffold377919_cov55-Attheya_sp.AAC.7